MNPTSTTPPSHQTFGPATLDPQFPTSGPSVVVVCSAMPMPSSCDAPHFTGQNLHEFLADFEVCTGEARWNEEAKCRQLPYYCKHYMQDLVHTFPEVRNGSGWETLKK